MITRMQANDNRGLRASRRDVMFAEIMPHVQRPIGGDIVKTTILIPMDIGKISINVARGILFRDFLLRSLGNVNGRWQNPASECVVGKGIVFYKHAVPPKGQFLWKKKRFRPLAIKILRKSTNQDSSTF